MYDANGQNTWKFLRHVRISVQDFLPEGRLSAIYIPTYMYIPELCIKRLKLENYKLLPYSRYMLWHLLFRKRQEAQSHITADMIRKMNIDTTHWSRYLYKQLRNSAPCDQSQTHLIDIIQHHEAHQMNNKFVLSPINEYDLLFRPMERLAGVDMFLHKKLVDSRFNIKSRDHLFLEFETIAGIEITPRLTMHDFFFYLSFTRHLSSKDLTPHNRHSTGPVHTLNPLEPFEADPDEPKLKAETYDKVVEKISKIVDDIPAFQCELRMPPSQEYLEEFNNIGGTHMSIANMQFLVSKHNDILRRLQNKQTLLMPEITKDSHESAQQYSKVVKARPQKVPTPIKNPSTKLDVTDMKAFPFLFKHP